MGTPSIQWHRYRDTPMIVDASRVAEVERALGVTFPPAYVALVTTHDGASPDRDTLPLGRPDIFAESCALGGLLSLDPGETDYILSIVETFTEQRVLPSGIVPFANDGGIGYLSFDYRLRRAEPSVVFWTRFGEEVHVVPAARSFEECLEMLRLPEPLE